MACVAQHCRGSLAVLCAVSAVSVAEFCMQLGNRNPLRAGLLCLPCTAVEDRVVVLLLSLLAWQLGQGQAVGPAWSWSKGACGCCDQTLFPLRHQGKVCMCVWGHGHTAALLYASE